MSTSPTFDKTVDSPLVHRELKNYHISRDCPGGGYNVGDKHDHVEPQWERSQRFGCKVDDHDGIINEGYPTESRAKKVKDTSANHDWTEDAGGSSVNKVLKEKRDVPQPIDKSSCDQWVNTSCAKVIPRVSTPETSPTRDAGWSNKLVPNEPKRKPSERLVNGWATDNGKVLPKEEKRELNLCPARPPAKPPAKIIRPEDWDSNLKTLPDAQAKGVANRKPHIYGDIKDSIVRHEIHRSATKSF